MNSPILADGLQTNAKILLGSTPNGKQLIIKVVSGTSMYGFEFSPGGELPKELEGAFTHISIAEQIGNNYLTKRQNDHEVLKEAKEHLTLAKKIVDK